MLTVVTVRVTIFVDEVFRTQDLRTNLSLVTKKTVVGVTDQVRLKPGWAASEASKSLEILDIETRGIILSRKRTTKTLFRLRGCAG